MKTYIKKITLFAILVVVALSALITIKAAIIRSHSWKIDPSKHILFMGASHLENGIDDSEMESAINWSKGSERYMYTYIKLQHLLEENTQIDTIYLEMAATDMDKDTDYKYHVLNEQSFYVKSYWPYFTWNQWKIFRTEPRQVAWLIINSLLDTREIKQDAWWKSLGGYSPSTAVLDTASIDRHPAPVEGKKGAGHKVNYEYLHKIIHLCKAKNVALIFMETPTYELNIYYDIDYYHKAYQDHFSDVPFLDYTLWTQKPENFRDCHHLNDVGSKKFTHAIMEQLHIK